MKFSVGCLLVLFCVAFVRSDEPATCRCAVFVSSPHNEYMVYQLDPVTIDSCESHSQCKNRCVKEDTTNLDLWAMMGEDTVGQAFCHELYSHHIHWIHNSYVHGYYEMCGGPWEYTGMDSQQQLCCSRGQQKHCIA
ncbi:uncharacterized protein LOC135214174 [Macrobrachium nipponense]|uniref:uncharacterized protein LOC135214174 n=1 Tax=Macrobrachium nipponense TaxID=159736 RepID=UPI0030C8283F